MEKTQKIEDPWRVEVGKRLAAIFKEAKENKARERANAEQAHDDESSNALIYVVTIVTLRGLCYGYYTYNRKTTNTNTKSED